MLFQVLDSPCAERQGGMYDELKRFLKPARLFERDFVIMPIKLPGHWAVMVICFPLSVVQSLLQLSCRDGAASATSLQAVKPGIIYLDSMGSKGSWWRAAAAQVLVETYAAQQCELSCPDLAQWPRRQQVPGPELSPPGQIDMWRCGDHVLHYVRRFIRDMALAALDSGSRKTPVDLERTITPEWFQSDEVKQERQSLVQYINSGSLQEEERTATPECAGASSESAASCEWQVMCNEIETAKADLQYMNELEAAITSKLATFPLTFTTASDVEDTTLGATYNKVIVIFQFIMSQSVAVRMIQSICACERGAGRARARESQIERQHTHTHTHTHTKI